MKNLFSQNVYVKVTVVSVMYIIIIVTVVDHEITCDKLIGECGDYVLKVMVFSYFI